ncbi:hypothetical protein PQG02_29290 [Nostoc sp. UHCC 0926]|uniref:hypothetical protein n=1 Tax=unclassified Nostoc TaxID=2593658 RepID=UPI0023609B09|nr:hypothetical protein [Nostoc sp. UHCC 0926]WDD32695.1 hypothetical protein PQG02_29290 [Nostoc sp. UHCC 0926]
MNCSKGGIGHRALVLSEAEVWGIGHGAWGIGNESLILVNESLNSVNQSLILANESLNQGKRI